MSPSHQITESSPPPSEAAAPLEILFEDEVLVVVSKPQGLPVHPAPGAGKDTLVGRLWEYYEQKGFPERHIAPISRLDRGTSGLVLLATDPSAHPGLHHQVVRRRVRREYQCLVYGCPRFTDTVVDVPIGRHWLDQRRMAAYDLPLRQAAEWGAREARTNLRVLQRFENAALIAATLETGRMHQIRVHCQFIRLPILGDPVYGPAPNPQYSSLSTEGGHKARPYNDPPTLILHDRGQTQGPPLQSSLIPHPLRQRADTRPAPTIIPHPSSIPPYLHTSIPSLRWQCLHAGRLQFRHPLTGQEMEFVVPPPPPFSTILDALSGGAKV